MDESIREPGTVRRVPVDPLAVGDTVHYLNGRTGPLAAIVCKIFPKHDTTFLGGPAGLTAKQPHACLVNLAVFSEDGQMLNKIKVPYITEWDAIPSVNYCTEPKVEVPDVVG